MTVMTVTAAPFVAQPVRRRGATDVGTRASSPARTGTAPAAARPAAPLRLTRRGRLAITGALSGVGIAVTLFTGSVSLAGTDAEPVPVSYVTVAPGETLWAIAGEVAPGVDRRDTIQQILELNALDSSGVQAGQRIAVPASR